MDPCTRKRMHAKYCYSIGDMYTEIPYNAVNHGNYYFRPYHYSHVGQQQMVAARWGADHRIPYQTNLFAALYSALGIPLPVYLDEEQERRSRRDRSPSDHFTPVP